MKVVDRKTVLRNMGNTRTAANFDSVLGNKSHKMGLVASLFPDLAATALTDALHNVFRKGSSKDDFTPINSMAVEWSIDVNYIHKVYIAETFTGVEPGKNQGVIDLVLDHKYYSKNDSIIFENRQQGFIIAPPVQLGPKRWKHSMILVGNDMSKSFDPLYLQRGKYTRFVSNAFPELSERGYSKYISNSEKHRNYLQRFRASEDVSAEYLAKEKVYVQQAKKDGNVFYEMHTHQYACMETFMLAKNNAFIIGETNYDANGKCTVVDEEGRDIPFTDGVIAQIERVCDKFLFNKLTTDVLDDVLFAMVEKSSQPTGNKYAVMCNERFWFMYGKLMKDDYRYLAPNDASYMYSKEKGGDIKVGGTFNCYKFQGNEISFIVDRCLSQEFPDYAYGIFLDVAADMKTGKPGMASFTMSGMDMVEGNQLGLGREDGKTSGEVSTGIPGKIYHLFGMGATVVFNPYKSFILKENKPVY